MVYSVVTGLIFYANRTLCMDVIGSLHCKQCDLSVEQLTQHSVCPHGQNVTPTGLLLHTRHIITSFSLCNSISKALVLDMIVAGSTDILFGCSKLESALP